MEVFHELGCELGSRVTDYFTGNSELLPYVITEEFGSSHGGNLSSGGDGDDVLGELVNNYHYCIVSLRYWQSGDEVDSDVFPRLFGYSIWS